MPVTRPNESEPDGGSDQTALSPAEPVGGTMNHIPSLNARTCADFDLVARPMTAATLKHWRSATDADYHDENPDDPPFALRKRVVFVAMAVAALCLISPEILSLKF